VRTVHNVQQIDTMEEMGRNVLRIYVALDNKHSEFQSHMIEVEGNINDQPIVILIDSGASHGYLDPNMVEIFHFTRSKLEKFWLVQLNIGDKRRINEMVKEFTMDIKGLCTREDLDIIPLGSYDCLIGMDWLDTNHVFLDFYIKAFTFLDEEWNLRTIQGIPRVITIKEVSIM
jgi:hypothetical protein